MLLDIQMPLKTGIEVVKEVRKFYKFTSQRSKINLIEPEFIFLTAFSSISLQNHIKTMKINHCYEKPATLDLLKKLLIGGDELN